MRSLMVLLPLLTLAACDRQSDRPEQAQGASEAPASGDAKAPGMGKVDVSKRGTPAPAMPFTGPDGAPATLSAFRGKPLLVNLWATWCAPCVAEMPTLDRLAAREKDRIQLIVVSQDMAGKRVVDPYFAKARFTMLKPYLDKENVLMLALGSETLPTTVFYDADGKEQWRVIGAMEWDGERAKTLIEGALD